MNAALFDPPEELLRAAWAVRKRHGWPETFEETMQNPILHRLIKMHVLHGMNPAMDRRARLSEEEAMASHKVIELPPYDPKADRKRLAANDKDD